MNIYIYIHIHLCLFIERERDWAHESRGAKHRQSYASDISSIYLRSIGQGHCMSCCAYIPWMPLQNSANAHKWPWTILDATERVQLAFDHVSILAED